MARFKHEQSVMYDGTKEVIQVVKKDFGNNKISYRFHDSDEYVSENDPLLTPVYPDNKKETSSASNKLEDELKKQDEEVKEAHKSKQQKLHEKRKKELRTFWDSMTEKERKRDYGIMEDELYDALLAQLEDEREKDLNGVAEKVVDKLKNTIDSVKKKRRNKKIK